jgi:hypothetical protein
MSSLVAFMAKARTRGIREIIAIGGDSNVMWDRINAFHNNQAPFDGLLTEIEFWNQDNKTKAFEDFLGYLRHVRSLTWSHGLPPLAAYIGWPNASQISAMAPLLDSFYVHAYVRTPDSAFGYAADRLQSISSAARALKKKIPVRFIFSAESALCNAGVPFMGSWMAQTGATCFTDAENVVTAAFSASGLGADIVLQGFQYYEYFYLRKALPS